MSSKNFMSYEDATTVLCAYAEAIKNTVKDVKVDGQSCLDSNRNAIVQITIPTEYEYTVSKVDNLTLKVTTKQNGVVTDETNYTLTGWSDPVDIDGHIQLNYNISGGTWSVETLVASTDYPAEQTWTWVYNQTPSVPVLTFEEAENHIGLSAAYADLKEHKQDILTFDNAPTENSNNPVTSGGVYSALAGKQNAFTAGDDLKFSGNTLNVEVSVPYIDEYDLSTDGNGWTVVTKKHKGEVVSTNTYQSGTYATYDIDGCFTLTCGGSPYWQVVLTKASTDDPVGTTYGWGYGETPAVSNIQFELAETGTASEFIADLNDALAGKQDTLTFDDVPTANSNNPVKSGGVKSAIDAAVSRCYHHAGTKTCAELVAGLLVAANEGNVYNMTDSGTTTADFIEGTGQPIKAGDNVGIAKISDGVYKFDLLSGFVDTTNFVQKSVTAGLLKNDGTVDTTIQGDVSTLKSGLTTLNNEVNGDAVEYPYADVITIEDAVPANLADCNVKIEPAQDLHGQSAPYVGGAGKNKLPMTLDVIKASNTSGTWSGNVYSENGATITILTDSDDNVTGIKAEAPNTPSDTVQFNLCYKGTGNRFNDIENTSVIMNGCPSGGSENTYYIQFYKYDGTLQVKDTSGGVTFTPSNIPSDARVRITIKSAIPSGGVIFYPMIRLATETDATFAPYTNYCPITGHTEASVDVTGASVVSVSQFSAGTDTTVIKEGNTAIMTCDALDLYRSVDIGHPGNLILSKGTYRISFDIDSVENSCRIGFRNYDYAFKASTIITGTGHYTDVLTISENCYVSVLLSGATPQTNRLVMSNLFVSKVEHTATIALGDTIYGGTVNFKTGVLTVDRKLVDLGDYTWAPSGDNFYTSEITDFAYNMSDVGPIKRCPYFISDKYVSSSTTTNIDLFFNSGYSGYRCFINGDASASGMTGAEFKEYITGTHLCYELATPTTIQLTPQQIQLLKGTNTLTASTGQISVSVNGVAGAIGELTEAMTPYKQFSFDGTPDANGMIVTTCPLADYIPMTVFNPARDGWYYEFVKYTTISSAYWLVKVFNANAESGVFGGKILAIKNTVV